MIRNPLNRYKYDTMIANQMDVLQNYRRRLRRHVLQLNNAVVTAQSNHGEAVRTMEAARVVSLDVLAQFRVPPPVPVAYEFVSGEEYAAAVGSLPCFASCQALEEYALWWYARDEEHRARSNASLTSNDLEVSRIRRDRAVKQLTAIDKRINNLIKEQNSQRLSILSEAGYSAENYRDIEADGKKAGILAALKWLEGIVGFTTTAPDAGGGHASPGALGGGCKE
ncbi:hypothetical protein F5144DRAFT_270945 [Chaetomium tenue]|uniref:Uncharacterized protein n=1 Tax=Chaetomium tenue TaxID=1854479 RepID=A0ACB7P2G6_9PEZI|nr:hypothetical protein F5144DRAFT_270945 [Chaetomium globosum]